MSAESTSLQAVRQLPAEPVQELVMVPDSLATGRPAQPSKKDQIRRTLIAGAAVALLASASGYGSVQNAQNAQARNTSAVAAIARDKANLASAQKQVELLKAELAQAVAAAAKANALERQAELNLSYTTIVSPIDGVAGNRTLR